MGDVKQLNGILEQENQTLGWYQSHVVNKRKTIK